MLTNYSFSICNDVPVYMAAVLEYLVTEVISCAGEAANARMSNIKPRHLQIVFQNNEELRELMTGEYSFGVKNNFHLNPDSAIST